MNTEKLVEAVRNLIYPNYGTVYEGIKINTTEDFVKAREIHREKVSDLEAQWKQYLGEAYASDINSSGKELIFNRAWAESHGHGYYDVEGTYEDLADFGRAFLSAVI